MLEAEPVQKTSLPWYTYTPYKIQPNLCSTFQTNTFPGTAGEGFGKDKDHGNTNQDER